jgi:hypothetical protein
VIGETDEFPLVRYSSGVGSHFISLTSESQWCPKIPTICNGVTYWPKFKSILEGFGIDVLFTSYLAPNMNAYAERFVESIKSECLDQMIFLGRESLVRTISEYAAHYHEERSHQGIGNLLISGVAPKDEGIVEVRERLGGLLKYDHRRAA